MNADTPALLPARGRLAPSPTGSLHLGNAFAFLMAWLSVRRRKGSLVLRVEDLDPERSRPEHIRSIMEDLLWLGLDWDEGPREAAAQPDTPAKKGKEENVLLLEKGSFGPYRQSLRTSRYEEVISELRGRGCVYPCYCTRKELRTLASAPHIGDEGAPYPGTCRRLSTARRRALEKSGRLPSLRLNTEAAAGQLKSGAASPLVLRFFDGVLGEQNISLQQCGGDFVLRRSDGVFAYQLAVAVDDADMGISEVVRGDDLLLSTPRQLLLFSLLGAPAPRYIHVPLLHDAAGERLAKRHKSFALGALRLAGVSPQEVLSYLGGLALCLEHAAGRKESREELLARMIAGFSPDKLKGRKLRLSANAPIAGLSLC
jgi:glutamyl-tRNA synthetase